MRAIAAASLCLVAAGPALAQQVPQAPGVGSWQPGPAASGDHNSFAGVIDVPASGSTVATGTLQLSGWFIDLTAQGWSGVDDVEIFAGSMDGGGKPLGHAQFAQNRPDVAASLNQPYWAQSGWSATVPTAGLPSGPTTISVYVHTPARGWWLRQVSVTLRAPPLASAVRPSTYGNDLSYPQCPSGAEPQAPAFAIVGVTDGRPFTSNPCLARQYAWALSSTSSSQSRVSLYLNTANPGPDASPNWPAAGTTSPKSCDGSWTADCAYDYGWLAAQDAFNRASGVVGAGTAHLPWWIDVEAVNSWSGDMAVNAADLQGVLAFLQSQNVSSIGIYATSTDWEALIGPAGASDVFSGLANWRPGPANAQDAQGWCSRTVTGGRVKYVQFPSDGFDSDLACF